MSDRGCARHGKARFGAAETASATPNILRSFTASRTCATLWDDVGCGGGAISYVPPVPKTDDGTIKSGAGRMRCAAHQPYHQGRRWHVEGFISRMKRACGSTLAARSEAALLVEAALKGLASAIRR